MSLSFTIHYHNGVASLFVSGSLTSFIWSAGHYYKPSTVGLFIHWNQLSPDARKKHNRLFHGCAGIKVSRTLFGIERGARRDSLANKDRLTHSEAVHGQSFVQKTDSSSNLFAVNCCVLSAAENRLMRFPGLPHQTSNAGKRQVPPLTWTSAKRTTDCYSQIMHANTFAPFFETVPLDALFSFLLKWLFCMSAF